MNLLGNGREILFQYHSKSKSDQFGQISLNICNMNKKYGEEELAKFLSPVELSYYDRQKSQKRKRELFWGRMMAKKAVVSLKGGSWLKLKSITVSKGHFNNPLLKDYGNGYQVSITHSNEYAAAIAYPEELIFAVDLEAVNLKKEKYINEVLVDKEKSLCPPNMKNELFVLGLWTAKEALVKFLKIGLDVNFEVMQISDVKLIEDGIRVFYRFFPSLEGRIIIENEIIYAMVYSNDLYLEKSQEKKEERVI